MMDWNEMPGGQVPGGAQSSVRVNRRLMKILSGTKDLLRIDGRYAPGRMLAVTIVGIALAEVIAMIVVYNFRGWTYVQQVVLDAAIMTVIIYPLLYNLSFKPLLVQLQQQSQSESILQSRLRLRQFADTHTLDELLQFALDEVQTLTGSSIGFFHFLEADQKTLNLQAWSTNTLRNMCTAEGKGRHYDLEQAGVWADAVHKRQPVIHNDYAALQHRKGLPEGHARIVREMVIPILREQKMMAILGVGNKAQDFTATDIEIAATLADFAWDVIEHKRAEMALHQSEEKFRTFVDWTYDWEMWMNPDGDIIHTSPSCERVTGYSPEELVRDPGLLARIAHPDDRQFFEDHQKMIHDEKASPDKVEYRILSRDGSEHWIEHVCRPLFEPDGAYLGRRISNRDITDRKQAEKKIAEQNQKELILAQTIQNIQTDIARDLHDTLGQNISYLRMNLAHLAEAQWSNPAYIDLQIQKMTKTANESYEMVREMLASLQTDHSADPLSLFTRYAQQVAQRSSFQIDITSKGNPNPLSRHQTRQLFYIFREALNNIEKYAGASQVSGEFTWVENALTFEISDNGHGYDPGAVEPDGHYGLKFMRERALSLKGSFSIQSAAGQGTKITVTVPYENESAQLSPII